MSGCAAGAGLGLTALLAAPGAAVGRAVAACKRVTFSDGHVEIANRRLVAQFYPARSATHPRRGPPRRRRCMGNGRARGGGLLARLLGLHHLVLHHHLVLQSECSVSGFIMVARV